MLAETLRRSRTEIGVGLGLNVWLDRPRRASPWLTLQAWAALLGIDSYDDANLDAYANNAIS